MSQKYARYFTVKCSKITTRVLFGRILISDFVINLLLGLLVKYFENQSEFGKVAGKNIHRVTVT